MTLAYGVIFIVPLLGNFFGLWVASKKSPFDSVANLYILEFAACRLQHLIKKLRQFHGQQIHWVLMLKSQSQAF